MPLHVSFYGRNIRTLVFVLQVSPKWLMIIQNFCAYVELRTPISRKILKKLRTLPTLTRLVLVVHGKDYEIRRNIFTGVIIRGNRLPRTIRNDVLRVVQRTLSTS